MLLLTSCGTVELDVTGLDDVIIGFLSQQQGIDNNL